MKLPSVISGCIDGERDEAGRDHVAWAGGRVQKQEREAILNGPENAGVVADTPAYSLLQSRMKQEPTADLFEAWNDCTGATSATVVFWST